MSANLRIGAFPILRGMCMSNLLKLLARAFDTKGYPDDKNPENWRKINGSPVHLDGNGNIDGGAGGKFAGKVWSSSKHPHNPTHYPKPAITKGDLQKAWAKVAKCQVAMKRAKTKGTFTKQQQNMMTAIKDYQALVQQASPQVQSSFKPNVALAHRNATSAVFTLSANNTQKPGAKLTNLANAVAQQNLQQTPKSGNIGQKGRNVKIYNLSKKGVAALTQFAQSNNIPRIGAAWASNDANSIGKDISQYLDSRNKNYWTTTIANIQKMNSNTLFKILKKQNHDNLNPTLSNKYTTQLLSMALGNNNPPRVVGNAEFRRLAKKSPYPVLYRGVKDAGILDAKTIADDFKYGDTTWMGGSVCIWGVGLYSSTSKHYASFYGKEIIEFLPDPQKVKIIEWDDLCDEAKKRKVLKSCSYNGGGQTRDADRMTTLALQLGYNMIKVNDGNNHCKGSFSNPNGSEGDFYVVLDRGCLIAKK